MNNRCFNPLVQYNKITFGLLMTVEKGHAGSGEGYAGMLTGTLISLVDNSCYFRVTDTHI